MAKDEAPTANPGENEALLKAVDTAIKALEEPKDRNGNGFLSPELNEARRQGAPGIAASTLQETLINLSDPFNSPEFIKEHNANFKYHKTSEERSYVRGAENSIGQGEQIAAALRQLPPEQVLSQLQNLRQTFITGGSAETWLAEHTYERAERVRPARPINEAPYTITMTRSGNNLHSVIEPIVVPIDGTGKPETRTKGSGTRQVPKQYEPYGAAQSAEPPHLQEEQEKNTPRLGKIATWLFGRTGTLPGMLKEVVGAIKAEFTVPATVGHLTPEQEAALASIAIKPDNHKLPPTDSLSALKKELAEERREKYGALSGSVSARKQADLAKEGELLKGAPASALSTPAPTAEIARSVSRYTSR